MRRLISVTQALAPFNRFDGIPPVVLQEAQERGNRLHAAAAAYILGVPLLTPLLPEDEPLFQSLKNWIDKYVEDVYGVEEELIDAKLGVVGHPDLVARVHGMLTIVDWKTPKQRKKAWAVQLAGYCHLYQVHRGRKAIGMAVQPDHDGGPANATPYTPTGIDLQVFLSAVNCCRYFL